MALHKVLPPDLFSLSLNHLPPKYFLPCLYSLDSAICPFCKCPRHFRCFSTISSKSHLVTFFLLSTVFVILFLNILQIFIFLTWKRLLHRWNACYIYEKVLCCVMLRLPSRPACEVVQGLPGRWRECRLYKGYAVGGSTRARRLQRPMNTWTVYYNNNYGKR